MSFGQMLGDEDDSYVSPSASASKRATVNTAPSSTASTANKNKPLNTSGSHSSGSSTSYSSSYSSSSSSPASSSTNPFDLVSTPSTNNPTKATPATTTANTSSNNPFDAPSTSTTANTTATLNRTKTATATPTTRGGSSNNPFDDPSAAAAATVTTTATTTPRAGTGTTTATTTAATRGGSSTNPFDMAPSGQPASGAAKPQVGVARSLSERPSNDLPKKSIDIHPPPSSTSTSTSSSSSFSSFSISSPSSSSSAPSPSPSSSNYPAAVATPNTPTFSPSYVSDITLRVVDYEYVTGGSEKYTVFLIEVAQYGVSMIVKKRFSQIMEFHQSLALKNVKPPPKRMMENQLSEEFIKNRMEDIGKFLTELMFSGGGNNGNITKNEKFVEFFQLKDLEERKKDSLFVQKNLLQEIHNQLTTVTTHKENLETQVITLNETIQSLTQELTTTQQQLKQLQTKHEKLTVDYTAVSSDLADKKERLSGVLSTLKLLLEKNEKAL